MDIELQLTKANALFDQGEFEKAVDLYKLILKQDPGHVEVLIDLGCTYLEMGALEEAILAFKKVLGLPSGQMEAHLNLAMAYFKKESFDSAEFHSKIILNIDKYNLTALFIATLSCLKLNKIHEARKYAETMVLLDDRNPENYLILAEIHELSGERLQLIENLSKAIELDENLGEFYEKIALIHVQHGEIKEAINAYENLLKYDSKADAILDLYFCYLLNTQFDEAIKLTENTALGNDLPRDYMALLALFLKSGPEEVEPHLGRIDERAFPSLVECYSSHTTENIQRIASALDDFHHTVNPPNIVFFSNQNQSTYIRCSDESRDQKKDILIWGCSDNTKSLKSLSHIAGFNPVGVVVERAQASEYEGVPVYGISDLLDTLSFHDTPIIVSGDGQMEGPDSFRGILDVLYGEARVPNRVLHGSCMLDSIRFPPDTHYVLTGYPGSGNLVHYHMLREILPEQGRGHLDPGLQVCSHFASDYYHSLMDLLNREVSSCGLKSIESAVILRNAFYAGWGVPGEKKWDHPFFSIYGLPSRFYAMTNLHMTHEPLGEDTLAFFGKRSLKTLVFIRHPLDIIVSCASKLARQQPEIMLRSPVWFSSMIDVLSGYLADYLRAGDKITLFRYEDLLEKPEAHLFRLGKTVNQTLSESSASALWKRFGFKPLDPNSPKHLWRPGINKWAKYLAPWHLDLVKKSDLIGLAAEFGYDFDLDLSGRKTYSISDDIPDHSLYDDFTFHSGMGKRMVAPLPENLVWEDRAFGVMAMSNDPEVLKTVRPVLESSRFRNFHRAAFWRPGIQTLLNGYGFRTES